jgi:hypothetical protein
MEDKGVSFIWVRFFLRGSKIGTHFNLELCAKEGCFYFLYDIIQRRVFLLHIIGFYGAPIFDVLIFDKPNFIKVWDVPTFDPLRKKSYPFYYFFNKEEKKRRKEIKEFKNKLDFEKDNEMRLTSINLAPKAKVLEFIEKNDSVGGEKKRTRTVNKQSQVLLFTILNFKKFHPI